VLGKIETVTLVDFWVDEVELLPQLERNIAKAIKP
jgi:hypothetical protein